MKTLIVKAQLVVFAAFMLMSIKAHAAAIAEWPGEFTGEKQGANGWWYLYSAGKEYMPSETGNQMDTNTDRYYSSAKTGSAIWYIGTMLPGLSGNPVLRCVSQSTVAVTIKGTIQNNNVNKNKDADGWTFFIMINGVEKWNKKIESDDAKSYPFEFNSELKSGDKIDFLLDRGANKWFDEAIVKIKIETKE